MFAAQLNNKFKRSEEDMEDLLTSNVFGVWQYLPPSLGLKQFLATAQDVNGYPIPEIGEIFEASLTFWPWYKHTDMMLGGEPDLLITLTTSLFSRCLVLIESKYLSGKSSFADLSSTTALPNDQLAREMQILKNEAEKLNAEYYALIYVTADLCLPSQDILDAINELCEKTQEGCNNRFFWTTWRKLPAILSNNQLLSDAQVVSPGYRNILNDLNLILHRMGLTYFEGFDSPLHFASGVSPWYFNIPLVSFSWTSINMPVYKYADNSVYNWTSPKIRSNLAWRYKQNEYNRSGNS
jgi:hypothetical protein